MNAMPPFKHWHPMTEEEYQALTGQPSSVLVISKRAERKPALSPSASEGRGSVSQSRSPNRLPPAVAGGAKAALER
jgi:hypothetical protein